MMYGALTSNLHRTSMTTYGHVEAQAGSNAGPGLIATIAMLLGRLRATTRRS